MRKNGDDLQVCPGNGGSPATATGEKPLGKNEGKTGWFFSGKSLDDATG
jgi:hypothetical protein